MVVQLKPVYSYHGNCAVCVCVGVHVITVVSGGNRHESSGVVQSCVVRCGDRFGCPARY